MTALPEASAGETRVGGGRTSRTALVARAVLAVLIAAAIAVAVLQAREWRDAVAREQAREDVMAAAEEEVLGLITISARTTDEDLEALIAGATAGFRDDLRAQADRLREEVVDNEVVATGDVVSVGVSSLNDDNATVLVAARGTVDNRNAGRPEPRSYRLEVTLDRVGDDWLVSALRFVA
jgi:Mce-associated membrane protein